MKLGFDFALSQMREGKKVRRKKWDGAAQFIRLVQREGTSHGADPFETIEVTFSDGSEAPWGCGQRDIVALDWECL